MTFNKITKGIIISSGALFLGLLASCDLSQKPQDYIPLKESFETIQDATKWDNGLYSTFRGKLGGPYILPQEVQADMLNAHATASSDNYLPFHIWDIKSDDKVLDQVYLSYYAALADANIILEQLPKVPTTTDEEKKKVQHFTGRAHFVRAFYHFNLTIRWGERYVAETADKDLSIPLATSFNPIEKPGRSTNKVAWAHILEDLDKAATLLADVPKREGNEDISADAVLALKARVLLYMGDMDSALTVAEGLISSKTYPLITPKKKETKEKKDGDKKEEEKHLPADEDPFIQMWHRDSGKEQIFQPFVNKPNEIPTRTPLYGADLSTYTHHKNKKHGGRADLQFNKPRYIVAGWVQEFFGNDDRRSSAYFDWGYTTVKTPDNILGPILVVAKFKGNPQYQDLASDKWGGYVPNGIQAPKPFRIAEQYLIAAEAAYKTKNEEKAKKYLNELRDSRGLQKVEKSGEELWKEIMDERTRELAFEGFRLWDLRRWGLDMQRKEPQKQDHVPGTPFLYNPDGFNLKMKRENSDPKFVWGFPYVETKANLKIAQQQNKGW